MTVGDQVRTLSDPFNVSAESSAANVNGFGKWHFNNSTDVLTYYSRDYNAVVATTLTGVGSLSYSSDWGWWTVASLG